MKTCSVCETPLPTPLDEFGPAKTPLCFEHFMMGDVPAGEQKEKIEEKIEELNEEIGSIEYEIDDLISQKDRLEGVMRCLEQDLKGKVVQITPALLSSWKNGLPKFAKDAPYDSDRTPLLLVH